MKSLAYWIQRADFSAMDYDPIDVAGAIRAFDAHPWSEELSLQSELEDTGREYCPPGIGFVDPGGPILHVCPTADGRAVVHFHSGLRVGLLAAGEPVQTTAGIARTDVVELIHHFFHGHHDWIVQKLGAR
jgi:hypothetical protein